MADKNAAVTALSQALKLEREGRAFYLKAAQSTPHGQGRAMFESLADDEKKHEGMVLRQLNSVETGGAYVPLPDLKVPAIDLDAKLFPPKRRQVEQRVGVDATLLEALSIALDNEIKSYDLYRMAAKACTDQAGREMYEWLAAAERDHFNLLMTNFETLVPAGS
jgi:rubrerythrin